MGMATIYHTLKALWPLMAMAIAFLDYVLFTRRSQTLVFTLLYCICIIRPHRSTTYVDAAYVVTDLVVWSVCLSVCRSVCHSREPCRNG